MTFEDFVAGLLPSPDSVTVAPYVGDSSATGLYGETVEVAPCHVDRAVRRQVRTAAGAVVRAQAVVYAPAGTTAPPWSLVTLPGGVVTAVLSSSLVGDAGTGLPAHLEIVVGQASP